MLNFLFFFTNNKTITGISAILFYNIIYFNLTSQYYKLMKLFLSLLSERREMKDPIKPFGFGWESNPGVLVPKRCVLHMPHSTTTYFCYTVKPDLTTTCEQRPPVNNGQFESSTASLNLSFIRNLCQTAAFFRSHWWLLYTGLTVLCYNNMKILESESLYEFTFLKRFCHSAEEGF